MASLLNRWFSLSLLATFFFTGNRPEETAVKLVNSGLRVFHPFHVSVTEVNHNPADKTLELSCKLFTDDFEGVLAKNYKKKVDLINPTSKPAMDTLVKKYILSHLTIRTNGKAVNFNYLGYEHDKEAVYCFVEVADIPLVSKFEITNSLLYDYFDDQMNIMHVIVGGNRKSARLNFPEKEVVINF